MFDISSQTSGMYTGSSIDPARFKTAHLQTPMRWSHDSKDYSSSLDKLRASYGGCPIAEGDVSLESHDTLLSMVSPFYLVHDLSSLENSVHDDESTYCSGFPCPNHRKIASILTEA